MSEQDLNRIDSLEAEALLRDARIAELVAEVDGLHKAMEHRAVIEQAKGIVMKTLDCGPEAAFAALVVQSQAKNVKLWEVAAAMVALHPDEPAGSRLPSESGP